MLNIKYEIEHSLRGTIFTNKIVIEENTLIETLADLNKNLEPWEIYEILIFELEDRKIENYKWKRNFEWAMNELIYEDASSKGLSIYYDEIDYVDYKIEEEE